MNWTNKEDKIVEQIVDEWNSIVRTFENNTIKICRFIKELTIDYPDESIKEILKKVKDHPKIKSIGVDRIYQGLRLINKRPELVEFHDKVVSGKKPELTDDTPYLKEDGQVFWEYYFELDKSGLSDGVKIQIEREGKMEKWSYRKLKEKIYEAKEDTKNHEPGYSKKEKFELIRQISGMIRSLEIHHLRGIFTLVKDFLEEEKENRK